MSLLKIPLLLSVALGIHITMSPPNPAPSATEKLPPTGLERIAPRFPILLKAGFGVFCLAEIAVIAAQCVAPNSSYFPAATWLLGTLDPSRREAHLKITPIFLLGWTLKPYATTIFARTSHVVCLRIFFTFELSIRRDHHLITTGVYSVVRHPSHTGAFLAAIGVALWHLTPGAWVTECSGLPPGTVVPIWVVGLSIACAGLDARMRKEDRMLRDRFRTEWDAWSACVRYKIFPGVH
ncbi:hypothetical protein B0H17DRAFT_943806 [Mycena rosella]|uniref:Protein-S-isoprenylcysteine O-methyltransferase n=1 Tax=Mycena rosella TaxID=1033263 RepID=A0AAD7D6S6_MYCRO|nr:hypothetical protein B0H17DRAFT_943806 [Mycena rosella]